MFSGATSFNQPLNHWDVSRVSSGRCFGEMFFGATSFRFWVCNLNPAVNPDPEEMFKGSFGRLGTAKECPLTDTAIRVAVNLWVNDKSVAVAEYGGITNWDTFYVTNMGSLFYSVQSFNADISKWDVAKVTDFSYMFAAATSFNQPLGEWDVSSGSDFSFM